MVREPTAAARNSTVVLSPGPRYMESAIDVVSEAVNVEVSSSAHSASVGCVGACRRGPASDIGPNSTTILCKLTCTISRHTRAIDKLKFVVRRDEPLWVRYRTDTV